MKPIPPPSQDRGPLRTLFLLTTMPVGGAETLLVNLIRSLDRERFTPEIACLKDLDTLGEVMANEVPTTSNYLSHKYDLRVLPRLTRYLSQQKIDVVVIVGAGDKMFWGRLAGFLARTPVVVCALHSTGWPDQIGTLNRWITPLTDGFVGCAEEHGRYLREEARLPASKVHVVPNGVDVGHFQPSPAASKRIREELRLPAHAPVCGIVAALRPEKNHELFLACASRIRQQFPETHFVVVGDGPERGKLERLAEVLRVNDVTRFVGTRSDVADLMAAMNCLLLTSKMEANPVSVLEGLATELPVVASRVGSVASTVIEGETGYLFESGNLVQLTEKVGRVLGDPEGARRLGQAGRDLVMSQASLEVMVQGYERLLTQLYDQKVGAQSAAPDMSSELQATGPSKDSEDLVSV